MKESGYAVFLLNPENLYGNHSVQMVFCSAGETKAGAFYSVGRTKKRSGCE